MDYARLYGQAALLSIISAGAQLSQPQQSNILSAASRSWMQIKD